MLDGIRINQEPAIILFFEEVEVIPVWVRGVVDEDYLQLPLNLCRVSGHVDFINNYYYPFTILYTQYNCYPNQLRP